MATTNDESARVAVLYPLNSEKVSNRRALNIGTWIADEIREALTISDFRPSVWRRGTEEEPFPNDFVAGLVVVTDESLRILQDGQLQESPFALDVRRACKNMQGGEAGKRVLALAFLDMKFADARSELLWDLGESAIVIEIDNLLFSEDDMHSRLQHKLIHRFLEVLVRTLPEQFGGLPSSSPESSLIEGKVSYLAKLLSKGWISQLQWSHFSGEKEDDRLSPNSATELAFAMLRNTERSHMLRSIQLRGNNLGNDFFKKYLAPALSSCPSLEKLILGMNDIQASGAEALAESIRQNTKDLALLFLNDNKIGNEGFRIISQELCLLETLESLNLDNNGITAIPENIGSMKNIRWLKLCRNHIRELPRQMTKLTNCKNLQLKGNPLQIPPVSIVEDLYDGSESSGADTLAYVHEYYNGCQKRESINVRVLGNGAVGKTTFIRAMQHYASTTTVLGPSGTHELTRGISLSSTVMSNELTVRFMEFGGQPQYLPIHRTFLDELSTVYVVLYRSDGSDDDHSSVWFWLNYILAVSKDVKRPDRFRSPVLLCSTFNDCRVSNACSALDVMRSTKDNTNGFMDRFQLKEANAFDLEYDNFLTISQCFEALHTTAKDVLEYSDYLPNLYSKVLVGCRQLADQNSSFVIGYDALKQYLESQNIELSKACLKVLTQMGEIGFLSGADFIVVHPQAMFSVAASIIEGKHRNGLDADGVYSLRDITDLLNCSDEEAAGYLKFLCCLNICFALDPADAHFTETFGFGKSEEKWVFPESRTERSSRVAQVNWAEDRGLLRNLNVRCGLRFQSRSMFLPPMLLSLTEARLRSQGAVIRCSKNTVLAYTDTKSLVVLAFDKSSTEAWDSCFGLDAIVCSKTKRKARESMEKVYVNVSVALANHFPQIGLNMLLLCPRCLSNVNCCAFPTPEKWKPSSYVSEVEKGSYVCTRTNQHLELDELYPRDSESSEWNRRWKYDVFLSHSGEDTCIARDLVRTLDEHDVKCFFDDRSFDRRDSVDRILPESMQQSFCCLCLITKSYCERRWTMLEYNTFREREQNGSRTLFPVIIGIAPSEVKDLSCMEIDWTPYEPILALSEEALVQCGRDDQNERRNTFSKSHLELICEKISDFVAKAKRNANIFGAAKRKTDFVSLPVKKARRAELVFISHAGEQKELFARPLFEYLEKEKYAVFLDEESIPPSGIIREEIYNAIWTCDMAAFILTEDFFRKSWPVLELELFWNLSFVRRKFFGSVLPLYFMLPYSSWPNFLEAHSRFRETSRGRLFNIRDFSRLRPTLKMPLEETPKLLDERHADAFVSCFVEWIMNHQRASK